MASRYVEGAMSVEGFVEYIQQTINGFAWAFIAAWVVWVVQVSRKGDQDAGKRD